MKPGSKNESWLVFDIETNGLYDKVTKVFVSLSTISTEKKLLLMGLIALLLLLLIWQPVMYSLVTM
jgi:hypothetical protein